jgi:hypothetical protein
MMEMVVCLTAKSDFCRFVVLLNASKAVELCRRRVHERELPSSTSTYREERDRPTAYQRARAESPRLGHLRPSCSWLQFVANIVEHA